MLFILTGDIQIGKTRWLQSLLGEVEAGGVVPYGVIAPGTWIEHHGSGTVRYEKTGIDNELLPSHEHIPFARRRDLALDAGAYDPHSQAAQLQLAWAIDDNAISRVNAHLDWVGLQTADNGTAAFAGERACSNPPAPSIRRNNKPGLLVVDELGRLELLVGKGLVSAMALLDRGATAALRHALVIVRAQLLGIALERFAHAPWNGM